MTALLPTATASQAWRSLLRSARPHRLLAVAAATAMVAGTAAGLAIPPILGWIVDIVVDGRDAGAITAPALLLVAAGAASAALTCLGDVLVARLGESMLAQLRVRVMRRALGMPLEQVERAGTGDLISRVSGDVSVVAAAARSAAPALLGAGLTIGLTLAGLAVLDWRFALAGLLAAPIQLYTLRWYLNRSTPLYRSERLAAGARTQQLLDSLSGARTVRAFGLSERHVGAVRSRSEDSLHYALSANRLATRFFGRLNLAEFIGLAAILATGYWLVRGGGVSVGATAAAALYFHRLFDPINTVLSQFGTAQQAAAGLARLVGIADARDAEAGIAADAPVAAIEAPADSADLVARGIVERPPGAVRLVDVSFGYRPGELVLQDISLEVAAGSRVALVGDSGAGKTTVAKLIAGVHRPTAGRVEIADSAARAADSPAVPAADPSAGSSSAMGSSGSARLVALVTQEVHVFAGSVAEDLRLASPAATDTQLWSALEVAGARSWVEALADGLDTRVGEGARGLAAVQAQQLALARLVLARPVVAVVDEATAESGSAGARVLDAALDRALRGRTAIVIAHRLSQAAACDRIAVLARGRIAEQGSHEELLAAGGAYAELWAAWRSSRGIDAATSAATTDAQAPTMNTSR